MTKALKISILKTFLVVLVIAVVFIITEQVQYSLTQDYAQIATEQVNSNTDSYRILKSQDNILNFFQILDVLIIFLGGFILFNTWFKYAKLVKKKVDEYDK